MAGNQVTLTFAGEDKPIRDSFDRVGGSAKEMGDKVKTEGFDKAGEAADGAETKAQGFADVLGGTTDVASGFGDIMKGDVLGGLVGVGGGLADLSGGLADFLIPALGKAKDAVLGMNFAFLSSPVFWIIAAIVVLIGVIVLIATKTDWFQKAWKASWGWIKTAASDTWDFIKKIPGWIGTAFAKVAGWISAPFRAAFNFVADAWNNTIGRLHFSIPGWVPGIGGNTISVPNLPHFHSGGTVGGPPGSEVLAVLQAGETVTPRGGSSGDGTVILRSDGSAFSDFIIETLQTAIGRKGGNVQFVLGR